MPKQADKQLLEIFGRANEMQVAGLLSSHLKHKFHLKVKSENERVGKIVCIALGPLSKGSPLDSKALNDFYPFSAVSSNNMRESVLEDIAKHLPTLLMPMQEACAMGCLAVTEIRLDIEAYNRELEEAVKAIFQATAVAPFNSGEPLTLRQEQLLFKHVALKGFGQFISWGILLLRWMEISQEGRSISQRLLPTLHFNQLLDEENGNKPQRGELKSISFQDYISGQTVGSLFRHPQALLPASTAEERVRKIITGSIRAQQDIIYYIDYLVQANLKDEFPIQEAVHLLRTLVEDKTAEHYPFLCTCLGFALCKAKLTIERKDEAALFKMIEQLDCHRCIPEDYARSPFAFERLDRLVQCGRIELIDCVRIVVKFAFTLPSPENSTLSPYLSSEDHFKLIDTIEQSLGLRIPPPILADFFLFQTAKKKTVVEIVNALIKMRALILSKWLEIAIPKIVYLELEELGHQFFQAFYEEPHSHRVPAFMRDSVSRYMTISGYLARAVQHVVYPLLIVTIAPLMPIGLANGELLFETKEGAQLGSLLPLFEDIPSGPGWICQWLFHPGRKQWVFSVSILNSILNPRHCYTFQIPLEIPESVEKQQIFFNLVHLFVDSFGKEVSPDNEETYLKENKLESPVSVTEELLERKGNPAELFDAFLACSPFLTKVWNEHELQLQEDGPCVKASLYLLISSFRSNLNKALYAVLNPELIDTLLFQRVRANHQLTPVHFDYENSLRESHPLAKLIPLLEGFFPIALGDETNSTSTCELLFAHDPLAKLCVNIEAIITDQSKSLQTQGSIKVLMTLRERDNCQQMTIRYQSFVNKRQFVQLMLMQADLLSHMHHRYIPGKSARKGDGATHSASLIADGQEDELLIDPISTLSKLQEKIKALCETDTNWSVAIDSLFEDATFIAFIESHLCLLGRRRALDPLAFQGLIQVWQNLAGRQLLLEFIDSAQEARRINLYALAQLRIPLLEEEHHKVPLDRHGKLNEFAATHLDNLIYREFKNMMNDMLYSRTVISNTQKHTEGLDLAFNSKARGIRVQPIEKKRAHDDDDEDVESPAVDNEKETQHAQESYSPRPNSSLMHAAWWSPSIGPQDPIKPLVRVIGFATKEGIKMESRTPLDFSIVLGTQIIYTVEERKALSNLLTTCDETFLRDPNAYHKWQKKKHLPEIQEALKRFALPDCPNLSKLKVVEKEELVGEALRFSAEVNYHFVNDLFTLG